MAGLGDFMAMCVGSTKAVPEAVMGAGKGIGSFFGDLSGLIKRT